MQGILSSGAEIAFAFFEDKGFYRLSAAQLCCWTAPAAAREGAQRPWLRRHGQEFLWSIRCQINVFNLSVIHVFFATFLLLYPPPPFPDQTLSLMANIITAAGKMKYVSVYLSPKADRNPRGKGKEQQLRRFTECQHSNGSEKYKTELLTTQGNKCSCGKNHTLMPISLMALWFRQRAEWRGVWAWCAAVLQPSCRMGGWVFVLPLVVFASALPLFSVEQELGNSPHCCWVENVTMYVCTTTVKGQGSPQRHGWWLISYLVLCLEVGAEQRSPVLLSRKKLNV